MKDRELLELAAKAAGYRVCSWQNGKINCYGLDNKHNFHWNPLTDDHDALRLAVQLGLRIEIDNEWHRSHVQKIPSMEWFTEPHNDNPYAATRRAIVLTAAQIAKTS